MIKLKEYKKEEFIKVNELIAKTTPMSTHYNSNNFLESYLFNKKRRIISNLITQLNSSFVIDVGCGDGGIAEVLMWKKISYLGIDISQTQIENAKKKINKESFKFQAGDICEMKIKENSFNVAVCTDVLEHVRDPVGVLMKLKEIVVNNGYIIISIPNEYLCSFVRLLLLRFPLHTPDHLYAIFPKDIKKYFKDIKNIIHLPFNTSFYTSLMSIFLIKNNKSIKLK